MKETEAQRAYNLFKAAQPIMIEPGFKFQVESA